MPFDTGLAERLRDHLLELEDVTERRMFGGLCILLAGHMLVGILGEELMVRVGPEAYADALAQPHAREMNFTGRPSKGLVMVAPEGYAEDRALAAWLDRAITFVQGLGPAAKAAPKRKAAAEKVAKAPGAAAAKKASRARR